MKPKPSLRTFLALAGSSLLAVSSATGTTLYWDGTDTSTNADGGAGTWNTSNTNWDTLTSGGINAAWNNTTPDSAIFGGTAGTVSLGSNITTSGLQFNTTGYTINTGSNTLSLSGTTNATLNNIALASITGNIGGSGNLNLASTNPATTGTLAFTGNTTGGWSGTTTVGTNITLSLDGPNSFNRNLLNTSGITLNGGAISSGNLANNANGSADRINNAANWTVNSGSFTWGSSNSGGTYAESIGTVTLNRGQMNFTLNGNLSSGSQTLTLAGLSQSGTSAVTFSNNATAFNTSVGSATDVIRVTGTASTSAGQIIGPWATIGTGSTVQTDYAIYVSDGTHGYVTSAGATLTTTGESGWGSATTAYQFGTGQTLTADRTAAALRYTAGTNAIDLAGFTLKTNGILNGGSGTLSVTGTGALTATGTSGGNLYINAGSNNITISSNINDNGGAVTVVKTGGGTLTLSSTTSNFSGGIVLNSGQLNITSNSNLGSGGGITVNGTATINAGDQYALGRTLTLNEGGNLTLNNGFGVTGAFSGNGALNVTTADDFIFANAANTFTGAITSATAANTGYGLKFNSIGDTAGAGLITLVGGSGTFHWMSDSGSTTTLVNRQFAISGTGSGMISARGTTSASNLVINRDLLITGAAGARTLTLEGTNLGNNTFAGKITDGTDGGASVVSLTKSGTSKWILTGANTYSGGTIVSGGNLVVSHASALGTGIVNLTGGTLESTVGVLSNNRFVSGAGGTVAASLGGSLGFNKFGSGTVTLNGTANNFTGGVTSSGGTLAVGASSSLGQNVAGNSILIRDAGILTLAAAANSGSNQAITLSSSSRSGGPVSTTAGGAGPAGRLAVLGLGFNGLPNGAISQANTNGGVIAISGVTGYNTDLSSVLTGKNLFLGATGTSTFTGAAGTVVAGNGSLYRLGGGGGQITFNTTNLFTGSNGVQVGSTFLNGGGTVVIQAAQDYTGTTTVSQGILTLSGANGTATGSSSFTLNGGRLFLDSSSNNNANRIGDTAAVTLSNGGELHLSGIAGGTTETMGNFNLGAGYSIVTAQPTTSGITTLAATAFSRTNNGTALFRGTALGQQTGAVGRVTLTDTTGLSFSSGTTLNNAANGDTTKDLRIIPYLVGATTAGGTGDSFVTYDTTLGFRVLNTTNQFNSSITANTNVRLTAAATGITSNTINSLIHTTGSSTIADGATLTISSGALLITGGNINQAGTTGILDFGANTGFITTTGNATIGARITGSGGLVKSGTATLTLSNINNSFTGDIVINSGQLTIGTANNGVLGNAANNIVVNGNAQLNAGNATFARSIALNNGAIFNIISETPTFSGDVTGTGGLAVGIGLGFSAQAVFSGTNNTFEGPILIGGGGSGNANYRMTFASLADSSSANGRIVFSGNAINGATGSRFEYTGGTGGNTSLVLNNRQIELASTVVGPNAGHQIVNNSTGTGTLTIATDLIVSTPIDQALALRGTNTGANTYSGIIGNGDARVSLIKNDAGRWILSNANTFSGSTVVSGGTLELGHSQALQNSALDTANSVAGTASAGLRTSVTSLTIGGLNGNKNFAATGGVFTTTSGGYGSVTALTLNPGAGVTTSYSGAITDGAAGMTLTKTGAGTQILAGISTYTGATTVSAGTLYVSGSLANSEVTVSADGTLGGNGALGNSLTIAAGGSLDLTGATLGLNSSDILSLTGGTLTLGNLTFQDIVGWDWANAAPGTYELIDGAFSVNFGSTAYLDAGSAYDFGNGNKGYFTSGSLNAVIVAIPEPRAALLAGLGLLMLLCRRRN